jgi:hypothetical protein
MWLVGKYGAVAVKPTDKKTLTPSSERVKSEAIADVLREARWKIFAELEEAASGSTGWLEHILSRGLVAKNKELVWVPVDRPGTRLRSRVLSLFAVDRLMRPNDYKKLLLACPRCESLVFDENARIEGRCCAERIAGSGVRRRSDLRRSIPPVADAKPK